MAALGPGSPEDVVEKSSLVTSQQGRGFRMVKIEMNRVCPKVEAVARVQSM